MRKSNGPPAKSGRATIKDIAKYTGYSIATVSRVLNDSGVFYSEETSRKIKKAIKDLNYQPDAIARGLKIKKTFNISFLEPWNSEFFSEIFLGIQEAANANNYSVAIFSSNYDREQENKNINTILSNRIDGVIMASAVLDKKNISRLTEHNIPLVIIEKFIDDKKIPSISIKNLEISKKAVDYLVSLGHRKIGFVGEPLEVGKVETRFKGYRRSLEEHNIKFDPAMVFVNESFMGEKFDSSFNYITANIDKVKKCTALFVTSDKISIALIKALKNVGLDVPGNISIVGFDGLEIAKYTCPSLTTVVQPKYDMGYEAMNLLLKVINGETAENIELKAVLSVGESTAKIENI